MPRTAAALGGSSELDQRRPGEGGGDLGQGPQAPPFVAEMVDADDEQQAGELHAGEQHVDLDPVPEGGAAHSPGGVDQPQSLGVG